MGKEEGDMKKDDASMERMSETLRFSAFEVHKASG